MVYLFPNVQSPFLVLYFQNTLRIQPYGLVGSWIIDITSALNSISLIAKILLYVANRGTARFVCRGEYRPFCLPQYYQSATFSKSSCTRGKRRRSNHKKPHRCITNQYLAQAARWRFAPWHKLFSLRFCLSKRKGTGRQA